MTTETPRDTPARSVSVVIPCYDEARHIDACLASVLANDYPAGPLEVVVVDGLSGDGTRERLAAVAAGDPRVRVLDNPGRTVPRAMNLGIAAATGDVIVRMDAHARYPADYIAKLVAWLERTQADNVGGACVTHPGADTTMARAIAVALGHPFGVGNAHFRLGTSRPREVDTVPFGCYRRSLFDRIGRFDEELVRNQDDELNHRLLRAGGRIVLVPDVVAHYYARATLRELARTYYQYGYFKPLALAKVGRAMTLRPLLPPAFVLALGFSAALAPASATAARVFAVVAGLYLVAALVAATLVARRVPSRVAACLPVVFMALHLSYGVGYLAGAWRWLGRPRGPFARHAAPHSNGGRPA